MCGCCIEGDAVGPEASENTRPSRHKTVKDSGNYPTFSGNYPTFSGDYPTFLRGSPRAIWRSYTLYFIPKASISAATSIRRSPVVFLFLVLTYRGLPPLPHLTPPAAAMREPPRTYLEG